MIKAALFSSFILATSLSFAQQHQFGGGHGHPGGGGGFGPGGGFGACLQSAPTDEIAREVRQRLTSPGVQSPGPGTCLDQVPGEPLAREVYRRMMGAQGGGGQFPPGGGGQWPGQGPQSQVFFTASCGYDSQYPTLADINITSTSLTTGKMVSSVKPYSIDHDCPAIVADFLSRFQNGVSSPKRFAFCRNDSMIQVLIQPDGKLTELPRQEVGKLNCPQIAAQINAAN